MLNRNRNADGANDVKHPKPFAYRTEDEVRPSLEPLAYRARELLNCTVASFYEIRNRELTSHQRHAKRDFIKLFERQAKIPLKDLDKTDLDLYSTLKTLMGYLDDFFFFGSLTLSLQPAIHNLVLTNFPPGMNFLGYCEPVVNNNGPPQFNISLDRSHEQHKGLPELVTTLAHEMTHVFLSAFVCDCARCHRNHINAVGIESSRHGPTFRGLNYAVMVSIADWSAELDAYFRGQTHGTYINPISRDMEVAHVEGAKQSGDLKNMGMLPYIKNPSHRLLIWISENNIRIDTNRLRANVRGTSARVGNMGARPIRAGRQAKAGNSSAGKRNAGKRNAGERNAERELENKFPDDWRDADSPVRDPLHAPDEESDADWAELKAKCIFCPASSCRFPIMKEG